MIFVHCINTWNIFHQHVSLTLTTVVVVSVPSFPDLYYQDGVLDLYFRNYVQGAQVNPRSMQQALSRALRRNATLSRGTDRYSRRDECP